METPSTGQKRKADDVGNISGEEEPKRQKVEDKMSEDTKETKKEKKHRRRSDLRPPKDSFILAMKGVDQKIIQEIIDQLHEAQDEFPGANATLLPHDNIRLLPTEQEKREERKKYRREYNKKPENIEKRRLKAQSPAEVEKRKLNNADPLIQERKKLCAIGRRKTLKEIKEKHPDIYCAIHAKHVPELPSSEKKKKRKSKKGQEEAMESESTTSSSTTNTSTGSE